MEIYPRFELTLQRILLDAEPAPGSNLRLAIAYSGGLDSAVLLDLCATYVKLHPLHLSAFHVHHGLSPNADQWVEQCQRRCEELAIPFQVAYVQLGTTQQDGVEATARTARYAALGKLCDQHQIDLLLTAHHQDDQAETMLLQLLRGSGIAGLRGMQQCHQASDMLGSERLLLARPLLEFSRAELERYCDDAQLSHVQDESNFDTRYTRNALRLEIMPMLSQHFPGFQSRLARTAQHAQSAMDLVSHLAQQDYELCQVNSSCAQLDAARLQSLPDERIDNVLRYWIALHGAQMPSSARLNEIRKQLMHARDDAQVCVKHGDIELHRYRQQLGIAAYIGAVPDVQQFTWIGEEKLVFPAFGGTLYFDAVSAGEGGINRTWLMAQQLELRPRQGGERLKLAANRPTRDMKSHYQTLGIPYWQRERLPFVFAGNDLLFASGVGTQGRFWEVGAGGVALRWQAD